MRRVGVIAAVRQWARDLVAPPLTVTMLDSPPAATFDSVPRPVDKLISDMLATGWGAKVSRSQALSVPAVLRGRNELCSIATLPLQLYRGLDIVPSPLLGQLDLNLANVVVLAATVEDLIFEGLSWWRILGRDFDGFPIAVEHVESGRISLTPPPADGQGQTPSNNVAPAYTGRELYLDGKPQPVRDFVRFDSPNPGLLQAGARAVRRAVLLDTLAATYADNPRPLDYFTDSDRTDVEPMAEAEVDGFLAEWQAMRKVRSTAWIPGNVSRVDVSAPSPSELQLVELQRQVTIELANALGVDPEDIGVSTTSRTYFNATDRAQQRVNRTLAPYMRAITDRLSMGDVTRRGYVVRFDLSDYLKADPATQITWWRGLYDMGAIDSSEVRQAAGFSGKAPAPKTTEPTAVQASVTALPRALPPGMGQRFDSGPRLTFAAAEFTDGEQERPRVDTEARTITGMALPYGAVAAKFGIRYRFAPGSLEYGSDVTRVKHLMDHGVPVGHALELDDGKDGLRVKLAVLGGPDGSPAKLQRDQLLHDAAGGLYDGLSVGVDFSDNPEDGDLEYDDAENIYTVRRATLREVSTTPMPAFDDARVTRVAASLTGGHMHCQHCGRQHAAGIACATFAAQLAATQPQPQPTPPTPPTQPQPGSPPPTTPPPTTPPPGDHTAAYAHAFASWLTQQQQGVQPAQAPVLVDPTGRAIYQVTDPAPYRFDRKGWLRKGSHDFSSDLFAGWNPGGGEQAARDRAEGFVREAFESGNVGALEAPANQFAITPANVVNLNYPANRPDLYVDQLDYIYPMYGSAFKGTLDTVTPFVIPKFNSSTGLVNDHVTGTEPTPGAFTATAQTITPSAVSGKVEITREAFDQGGNPQMSGLIWRQMTRGWYEALEAFVQAQLVANAASITDINLGIAVTDAAMDQSLVSAMTALQYLRGGDRFGQVLTQVDLFQKLAKAVDTTGRHLYPTLGAMNAVGFADPRYAWLAVAGKTFIPAWATAASGTVAASSWMFDPDVVCLWASAPQRIDITWRVAWVDMGIWGYKAFGITDFTRTRELVYDPV